MAGAGACLTLLLLAGCGRDPVVPPIQTDPPITSFDFLPGPWSVTVSAVGAGGAVTESTAEAIVERSLGGRALKETWVGTLGGATVEMRTLVVRSDAVGQWITARADGGAGTFDVLEGRFGQSAIVLTSRGGTRPDGGLSRETFESVTDSSFVRRSERSDDGGATWVEVWSMEYVRGLAGPPAGPAVAAGCQAPEHRQFDFWEGAWSVGGATNDLIPLLGGCVLEENWSSSSESGTSFNMFDDRTGLWYQVWTDTNGLTAITYGGLVQSQMILSGPHLAATIRITWTPLGSDVRQRGETSPDGGTTWTTDYDIRYTPR